MIDALLELLTVVLILAGFATVPLVARAAFVVTVRSFSLHEFYQVPLLQKLNLTAGFLIGALAVYHIGQTPFGEQSLLHPQEIFEPNGPWDLTFGEFLWLRAAAFVPEFIEIAHSIWSRPSAADGFCAVIALVCVVLAWALCFAIWPVRRAVAGSFACLTSAIVAGFLLFYAAMGAVWLISVLGPFVFLAPIAYLRPPFHLTKAK